MGSGFTDFVEDVGSTVVDVATNPTRIIDIAAAPMNMGLDLLGKAGLDPFEELGIPRPSEIATTIVDTSLEGMREFVNDPAGSLDSAFSKDGLITRFVEENVPAGGYFTAIAHAAAGNEDHAAVAMLKGAATAMETGFSVGGAFVGGPMGAAAGGALGAGARNLFEGGMRDLVPPDMQDRFEETDWENLAGDVVMGGAMGGRRGRSSAARVKKAAAKEGIEELTEDQLKDAMARDLLKRAFTKSLVTDAARDAGEATLAEHGIDLEDVDAGDMLELVTRQRFEDRKAAEFEIVEVEGSGKLTFDTYYDENLGEFFMRDGVVVWSKEEAEALEMQAKVQEKGFGSITDYREEMTRSYEKMAEIEAERGTPMDEWVLRDNEILGDFAVHDGKIYWGVSSQEDGAAIVRDEIAVERGYENADAFREDVIESWRMSHEGDLEAGRETGEAHVRSDEVLGDYVVKNGRIAWGVTSETEAEPILRDMAAQERGYDDAAAFRADLVESYRMSREYETESGATEDSWFLRDNDAVGPFMVVNGEVIFGVKEPDHVAQILELRGVAQQPEPETAPTDETPETDVEMKPAVMPDESVMDDTAAPPTDGAGDAPPTDGAGDAPPAEGAVDPTMAALLAELQAMRAEMAEMRAEMAELEAELVERDAADARDEDGSAGEPADPMAEDDAHDMGGAEAMDPAGAGDADDPELDDSVIDPAAVDDMDDWDDLPAAPPHSADEAEHPEDGPVVPDEHAVADSGEAPMTDAPMDPMSDTPMDPLSDPIADPLAATLDDPAAPANTFGEPSDPTAPAQSDGFIDIVPADTSSFDPDASWESSLPEEVPVEANEEDLAFQSGEQVEDFGTLDFGAEDPGMHDDHNL